MNSRILLLLTISLFFGCKPDPDPQPTPDFPELNIRDSFVFEQDGKSTMQFEVVATGLVELPIDFTFQINGITAEPDVDFTSGTGSTVMGVGTNVVVVPVEILADELNEVEEELSVSITAASNARLKDSVAIGIIRDNDDPTLPDGDTTGYQTAESYYGYEIAWADEFDGAEVDPTIYNFELEDGCPNLCGWGNNELQWYSDEPQNIRLEDGKLIIAATKQGAANYRSARIQTKGKLEVQFGRIDIRAKLPQGQGIWPAIWMLGSNIDQAGWPGCGEIDIMEMVGHEPNTVYGTAHWGPVGRTYSTYSTTGYVNNEPFAEKFHVFTMIWEHNKLVWYVDETKFKTITPAEMQGETYRFNQPFFFIFNIAIGGNWPGSPDATTVFPQTMEIDYVRVFQ